MSPNARRNAQILALRGVMSFGLIARHLGLTRNIVAGVCRRADRRADLLPRMPRGLYSGYAGQTLRLGRRASA